MRILKGYQPLCIINDKILLYKKDKLFLYDEIENSYQMIMKLDSNFLRKVKGSSRLLSRLFRTNVRNALSINKDEVLLTFNRSLYHLSLYKKKIDKLFIMRRGFSEPLNLCAPLKKSKYIAIFGDYGNNSDRKAISIYGVNRNLKVEEIYTFPNNTIRHIHNIIKDEFNNGYYVFTGDNEPEAGIYWTDDKFSIMKPVFIGNQNARAVCGFATNKGLLYATDSVSQKNYIYLLTMQNGKPLLKKIAQINGSCIYSARYLSGYIFSTTVESEESRGNRFLNLLSLKRGKGILSDDVHLIYVSSNLEAKIIDTYKKDKLPYKLFQYGAIHFPDGLENSDTLIYYPCAVKKFDGNTILVKSFK